MNTRTKFNDTYGEKPVFGGVYTTKPVDEMVDEIKRFTENGIHVYIEALRFRKDITYLEQDQADILKALDTIYASRKCDEGLGEIGINFLFEPTLSLNIAQEYGLPFVINDSFFGDFVHTQYCDKRHTFGFPDVNASGVDLFIGITPGYLVNEIPDGQWDNSMKSVNSFSDAVLVGNSLREEMLEQIIRYKDSGLVTKPMIASQGVNAGSLENIFKYADGVIMGSAFRDKGNVSLDKIKQVKEIQQQSI